MKGDNDIMALVPPSFIRLGSTCFQSEKGNTVTVSKHRRLLATIGFGAASVVVALCCSAGIAADLASIQNLQKDNAIYDSLPQDIKTAGVINAATEADYPPFDFVDEQNQLIGADLDISAALSRIMGVTIKNNKTEFSGIIPGIQAKRFDVGISSMGDYISREETMDFVDYYRGGVSFLVRAATPDPKSIDDVCGTVVGVLKGTSSEKMANENSMKCVSMGKKPIQVNAYPTQNDAVLALTSGRIESVSGDAATNGYSAKLVGSALKNVATPWNGGEWIAGIAVIKGSALHQPLYDAMAALIKSGVYAEILQKWGLEDGALPAPMKNQGTKG